MNNFKKGDRVVYTGERQKMLGRVPVNVGANGIVVAVDGFRVVVNWNKKGFRPAMECYHSNLALREPENEINKALDVLKKHGTVEFTPTPPPWEGDIYVCLKHHYDAEIGQIYHRNDVRTVAYVLCNQYKDFWRKIKVKEIR